MNTVCDKETKFNFRWSHVSEGVLIMLMLGLIYQFLGMRDYVEWSKSFHDGIDPTFFSGERWSLSEELRSQSHTNQQMGIMDKRMTLMESEHRHAMDTLKRIETAVTK